MNDALKLHRLHVSATDKLREQIRLTDNNVKLIANGDGLQTLKKQIEMMGQVTQNLPPRLNFAKLELPSIKFTEPKAHLQKSAKIATPNDLGKILKTARVAAGLNQEQLADIAGVGRRFISELENGKPSLEFGKVLQVATALGIDLIVQAR
jgi:y4mF family transcriptional regulator